MKKSLRVIAIVLITTILVACGNGGNEVEETTLAETTSETTTETTLAESTTQAPVTVAEESSQEVEQDEPQEGAVSFVFYVAGQEEPLAEYTVNNAAGQNILDTMSSIEGLNFNFNEDEGVIDIIEDYENDYATGNTWTYLLNDQYAEFGVVSQTLNENDQVSWYYGTTDELPVAIIPAEE